MNKPSALDQVKDVVAGTAKASEVGKTARKIMRTLDAAEMREVIERSPTKHSQFRHRPSPGSLRRARSA